MKNLPLQDMISGVIKNAREKLASEAARNGEPDKAKKLLAYEKREHGHIPSPSEEEEEHKAEKTASASISDDYVEKLAHSVDYIATHLHDVVAPSPLEIALAKTANGKEVPSPVSSAGALSTTQAIGGEQKYKKDSAAGTNAEDEGGEALSGARAHDGKTQIHNDMHQAPGQGSGAVPHATYPAKGPLVAGPTAQKTANAALLAAHLAPHAAGGYLGYTKGKEQHGRGEKHSFGGTQLASLLLPGGAGYQVGRAVGHSHAVQDAAQTPKTAGMADMAAKGLNAAKGFATSPTGRMAAQGALGGGALGAVSGAVAGGEGHRLSGALKGGATGAALGGAASGHAAHTGKMVMMPKTASELAKEQILLKLAGEDVMKANVSGGGTSSPLAGRGQLKSMDASEKSPAQAGNASGSGDGNGARSLIASNTAAINATKREAKKPVVAPLKEVLDQPAFSSAHDSKLNENLRNTGKAGVKIAGAQMKAELQKIASAGCICNGNAQCQYCTMTAKLASMSEGSGMSSMASAGGAPDGCSCGHNGECRVCKLNAAMHAAKGGHGDENQNHGS